MNIQYKFFKLEQKHDVFESLNESIIFLVMDTLYFEHEWYSEAILTNIY